MHSRVTADFILHGGHVLTLDPHHSRAEAVAITKGKILAVGSENELKPLLSSRTQLLSCAGKTVLPGFIDPHLHLFAWASRFCGVDLTAARSLADIHRLVAQRVRSTPTATWVRGYGYDEFFLAEKRHPTRQDLDAISSAHPILLRHRTGHAIVLNSVALKLTGLDPVGLDPVGLDPAGFDQPPAFLAGGHIERDPTTGKPTGVGYELEACLRTVIPPLSEENFIAGIRAANQELLRHGITSFHDASAGNTLDDVALFRRLHTDGLLTPRATVMVGLAVLPRLLKENTALFVDDAWTRLGSIKIMVHESRGKLHPAPDELAEVVWQAHRMGLQVAIHAVEEGPICIAVNAIAQAQARWPRADHRHRIEHCSLCPPPFVDLLRDTGSVVVTQPAFLHYYGDKYAAEVPQAQEGWLYRTKSFLENGVPVIGGSDCPIAPMGPLVGIQAAMTRRSREGAVINAQESLALHDALSLFTSAGAWVGFEEERKGRIVPGMFADLVILDGDITTVAPEEIGGMTVHATIIDGRVVWTAGN